MATNSPSQLNIGFVNENGYDQNGRPKSPYTTSNLKSDSLSPPSYYSATQMNNINSVNNNNNFYNNDNYNSSGRSANNTNTNQAPNYPQQPMPILPPPIRTDFNNSNSPFGPTNGDANQNGGFGNFNAFSDKNIRIRFVRKVYLILTCQLIFTFGIVSIFVFV